MITARLLLSSAYVWVVMENINQSWTSWSVLAVAAVYLTVYHIPLGFTHPFMVVLGIFSPEDIKLYRYIPRIHCVIPLPNSHHQDSYISRFGYPELKLHLPLLLLLMDEIPFPTTRYAWKPYKECDILPTSTGFHAGFQPSTVGKGNNPAKKTSTPAIKFCGFAWPQIFFGIQIPTAQSFFQGSNHSTILAIGKLKSNSVWSFLGWWVHVTLQLFMNQTAQIGLPWRWVLDIPTACLFS